MHKKKIFFYQHKILDSISLFILYPENIFSINTKYLVVFRYLYYTQKKKFFYQHKILDNISLFILYPEKKFFFRFLILYYLIS